MMRICGDNATIMMPRLRLNLCARVCAHGGHLFKWLLQYPIHMQYLDFSPKQCSHRHSCFTQEVAVPGVRDFVQHYLACLHLVGWVLKSRSCLCSLASSIAQPLQQQEQQQQQQLQPAATARGAATQQAHAGNRPHGAAATAPRPTMPRHQQSQRTAPTRYDMHSVLHRLHGAQQ